MKRTDTSTLWVQRKKTENPYYLLSCQRIQKRDHLVITVLLLYNMFLRIKSNVITVLMVVGQTCHMVKILRPKKPTFFVFVRDELDLFPLNDPIKSMSNKPSFLLLSPKLYLSRLC